jgi:hypothetical protein
LPPLEKNILVPAQKNESRIGAVAHFLNNDYEDLILKNDTEIKPPKVVIKAT